MVKPLSLVIYDVKEKVKFSEFRVKGLDASVYAIGAVLMSQTQLARVRSLIVTRAFTVESNYVCELLKGILNHTESFGHSDLQSTKAILHGVETCFQILNVFFIEGHFDLALIPIERS